MLRLTRSIWMLFDACVGRMIAPAPPWGLSAKRTRSGLIPGFALLPPATAHAMPTAPSAADELPAEQVVLVGAIAEAAVGVVAHAVGRVGCRTQARLRQRKLDAVLGTAITFGKYKDGAVQGMVVGAKRSAPLGSAAIKEGSSIQPV